MSGWKIGCFVAAVSVVIVILTQCIGGSSWPRNWPFPNENPDDYDRVFTNKQRGIDPTSIFVYSASPERIRSLLDASHAWGDEHWRIENRQGKFSSLWDEFFGANEDLKVHDRLFVMKRKEGSEFFRILLDKRNGLLFYEIIDY